MSSGVVSMWTWLLAVTGRALARARDWRSMMAMAEILRREGIFFDGFWGDDVWGEVVERVCKFWVRREVLGVGWDNLRTFFMGLEKLGSCVVELRFL